MDFTGEDGMPIEITQETFGTMIDYLLKKYQPYGEDELREAIVQTPLEDAVREAAAVMGLFIELPRVLKLNDGDRLKVILCVSAMAKAMQVALAHVDPDLAFEAAREGDRITAEARGGEGPSDDELRAMFSATTEN